MTRATRAWRKWALALGAASVLAVASISFASAQAPTIQRQGTLYTLTCGPSIYRFDAAWRVESVWTRDSDGTWTREAVPDPANLDRMRRLFLIRVGHPTLGAVPAEGQEELARLRNLGYI